MPKVDTIMQPTSDWSHQKEIIMKNTVKTVACSNRTESNHFKAVAYARAAAVPEQPLCQRELNIWYKARATPKSKHRHRFEVDTTPHSSIDIGAVIKSAEACNLSMKP